MSVWAGAFVEQRATLTPNRRRPPPHQKSAIRARTLCVSSSAIAEHEPPTVSPVHRPLNWIFTSTVFYCFPFFCESSAIRNWHYWPFHLRGPNCWSLQTDRRKFSRLAGRLGNTSYDRTRHIALGVLNENDLNLLIQCALLEPQRFDQLLWSRSAELPALSGSWRSVAMAIGVVLYNVALIVFIALHLAVGGAVRNDVSARYAWVENLCLDFVGVQIFFLWVWQGLLDCKGFILILFSFRFFFFSWRSLLECTPGFTSAKTTK